MSAETAAPPTPATAAHTSNTTTNTATIGDDVAVADATMTTSWSDLLGDTLLVAVDQPPVSTDTLLRDVPLVLLYFSAAWCPPCRAFSPLLKEFYTTINPPPPGASSTSSAPLTMAIIYVGSDSTMPEFVQYYGSMPWYAIPTAAAATTAPRASSAIKAQLSARFRVTGIPHVVVLRAKNRHVVTDPAARSRIQQAVTVDRAATKNQLPTDAVTTVTTAQQALVQTWQHDAPAVPLDQFPGDDASGGAAMATVILQSLLRQPAFLLLVFYVVRFLYRYYFTLGPDADASPPSNDVSPDEL